MSDYEENLRMDKGDNDSPWKPLEHSERVPKGDVTSGLTKGSGVQPEMAGPWSGTEKADKIAKAEEDPFEQDSEFATELSTPYAIGHEKMDRSVEVDENRKTLADARGLGWIGLAVAVASLFIWPAILGTIAAIIGVIAYIRGSKAMGAWTVVIGLVSLIAFFFLVPYYA